jgi:hypothetical protein
MRARLVLSVTNAGRNVGLSAVKEGKQNKEGGYKL